MTQDDLTFWGHLDVLRGYLIRIIVVTAVCAAVAFGCKETLFAIVLAPSRPDFVVYRLMGVEPFRLELVNIGLTEQFMIHVKTALYAGVLAASPYVIYVLYQFVAPALYSREKHYATRVVCGAYLMFVVGTLVNYFMVFPLTVRFLGTYQVSADIHNMLSLQSYMDTLLAMSLVFGILFEIPVLSWLLAVFGLLRAEWMQRYWRHALVATVMVAAVITPTGDIFTLAVVSLPIWLLYQASILIVRVTNPGDAKHAVG